MDHDSVHPLCCIFLLHIIFCLSRQWFHFLFFLFKSLMPPPLLNFSWWPCFSIHQGSWRHHNRTCRSSSRYTSSVPASVPMCYAFLWFVLSLLCVIMLSKDSLYHQTVPFYWNIPNRNSDHFLHLKHCPPHHSSHSLVMIFYSHPRESVLEVSITVINLPVLSLLLSLRCLHC